MFIGDTATMSTKQCRCPNKEVFYCRSEGQYIATNAEMTFYNDFIFLKKASMHDSYYFVYKPNLVLVRFRGHHRHFERPPGVRMTISVLFHMVLVATTATVIAILQ